MSYQKEVLGNANLIMIFASHSKKSQCAKGFICHFPTHARAILYSNFIIARYCQEYIGFCRWGQICPPPDNIGSMSYF